MQMEKTNEAEPKSTQPWEVREMWEKLKSRLRKSNNKVGNKTLEHSALTSSEEWCQMMLIGLVKWRLNIDHWFLATVITGDFACHLWPQQEHFLWCSEGENLVEEYLTKNSRRRVGDFKCRQLPKEFFAKRNKESIQCGKWKQKNGFS